MRSFLMILLFVSSAVFAEKVYQWTDPQGNVVFSDKPHPDAKQIDVPDLPSFDTQTTNTKKTASQTTKTQTNKLVYTSLKIISPKNEETIWSNQGIILVSVELQPALAQGDQLWVTLDGKKVAQIQDGKQAQLSNIDRGTHSVQVKIVDSRNKVVKTSDSITVFLHKTTVNQRS